MTTLTRALVVVGSLLGVAGFSVDSQTAVRVAISSAVAAVIAVHAALEALLRHQTQAAGRDIALAKLDAQKAATAASSPALHTDVDNLAGVIGQAASLLGGLGAGAAFPSAPSTPAVPHLHPRPNPIEAE